MHIVKSLSILTLLSVRKKGPFTETFDTVANKTWILLDSFKRKLLSLTPVRVAKLQTLFNP